jgi:peptidoglycan/xylan/chitin deacetylase (PgdA/CDA1 family)
MGEGLKNILPSCVDLVSIIIHPLSRLLGRKRVRILCYHRVCDLPETSDSMSFLNVSPEAFTQQVKFLSQGGFNVITLEELIEYKRKNIKLPPKTVILTFDDGYRDNYLNAFPILKKYSLRGTFFIVTDYIGSDRLFHWLKLGEKSLVHFQEKRQYWLPLSQEEILEMNAHGACFGSHTKSHCCLTQVDESEAMGELVGSKGCLEEILEKPVTCFCYPYGEVNRSARNWVRRAGYQAAVAKWGSNTEKTDLFKLRRIPINSRDSLTKFRRKVEGAYDWWFDRVLPLVIGVWEAVSRRRGGSNVREINFPKS